jgi:serine protease Do
MRMLAARFLKFYAEQIPIFDTRSPFMTPIKSKFTVALGIMTVVASGVQAQIKHSPALDLARQLNEAFIEVADEVSPAVVVIDVRQKVKGSDEGGSFWNILPPELRRHFQSHSSHQQVLEGEGSGVIISPDGYILTNNHVVEDADEIVIRLKDGRTFDGEVKGTDPQSDIAVVKIKATGLPAAKLGDSDKARVGEFVLAIGAPFELSDTVTVGHVSAKGRSFEEAADQDFIQTDAKILPGNSGGPLVNLYGEVIGINTMIEGLDTGIGFAVPINLASRVKDHLITEGKFSRSWLGIEIRELKDDKDYLSLESKLAPDTRDGVVVEEIRPGGPASKSELRPGDVIIAVDGKTIQTTRQLRNEISEKPAGKATMLTVVRGKEHLDIKAIPAPVPTKEELIVKTSVEPANVGLTVKTLTKEMADEQGIDFVQGVVVTSIEQNSLADERGIKAGDVITEVNRQRVTSLRQFREAVKTSDPKHGLMLNLISDGASRFVVLKDNSGN